MRYEGNTKNRQCCMTITALPLITPVLLRNLVAVSKTQICRSFTSYGGFEYAQVHSCTGKIGV